GVELWKSDGTAAGTVLVADIQPGRNGSYPSDLAFVNGALFFSADDGLNGREPWILPLDPSAAGAAIPAGARKPEGSAHRPEGGRQAPGYDRIAAVDVIFRKPDLDTNSPKAKVKRNTIQTLPSQYLTERWLFGEEP